MPILQRHVTSLYQAVFWPAAAGNLFWSIFTIIVDRNYRLAEPNVASSLIVLILLTIYLSIEWVRNYELMPSKVPWSFWFFDAAHLSAVVFAGLTAVLRPDLLATATAAFFAITLTGHWVGAWTAAELGGSARWSSLAANACGLAVSGAHLVFPSAAPWNLPVAYLVAILGWLLSRRLELRVVFTQRP